MPDAPEKMSPEVFKTAMEEFQKLPDSDKAAIIQEMAAEQKYQEKRGQKYRTAEATLSSLALPAELLATGLKYAANILPGVSDWKPVSVKGGVQAGIPDFDINEVLPEPTDFLGKLPIHAGAVAGALPHFFLPGGAGKVGYELLGNVIPKGYTALTRLGSVAAREGIVGGTYGGLSGAMEPGATPGSIIEQTALGAGLGAGLGALGSGAWMLGRKALGKSAVAADPYAAQRAILDASAKDIPTVEEALANALLSGGGLRPGVSVGPSIGAKVGAVREVLGKGPSAIQEASAAKTALLDQEFNRAFLNMAEETAKTAGMRPTTLALRPTVGAGAEQLSTEETTRLFSSSLESLDSVQTTQVAKLLELQNIRLNKIGTTGGDRIILNTKRLLTKQRLFEFGIGSFDDADLVALRENFSPDIVGARSMRRFTGVSMKGDAKYLFNSLKGVIETPRLVNPRPAGSLLQAVTVGMKSSLTPEEKLALHGAIDSVPISDVNGWKVSLTRSANLAKRDLDAIPEGPAKVDAVRIVDEHVKDIAALYEEATAAETQAKAARALAGELETGGLAVKVRIKQSSGNIIARVLLHHRAANVDDPGITKVVKDLVANGYEPTGALLEDLKKYAPDVLDVVKPVEILPDATYRIQLATSNTESVVIKATGKDIQKYNAQGRILKFFDEVPQDYLMTNEQVTKEAVEQGFMPSSPYTKRHGGLIAAGTIVGRFPPYRRFELENAPGLVKAMDEMGIHGAHARAESDDAFVSVLNTSSKLSKEEMQLFGTRLYEQEKNGVNAFTGKTSVDEAGRAVLAFRRQTLEIKAKAWKTEHGYAEATPEQRRAMDVACAKAIEEGQYIIPHVWRERTWYGKAVKHLMFYKKSDGSSLAREEMVSDKDLPKVLAKAKEKYGAQLQLDPRTGEPAYKVYTPQDYLKQYKDLLDYDSTLMMIQKTPGLSAEQKEIMLTAAARRSDRPDLISRDWVGGFDDEPKNVLKYIMQDQEHAIRRYQIAMSKKAWATAIQEAPENVQQYAREWWSQHLTQVPDYTYKVRSFFFTTILGGSVRFLFQQMHQNLVYSTPHFLATRPQSQGLVKGGKILGMGYMGQFWTTENMPQNIVKACPYVKKALGQLEKDGILQSGFLDENGIRSYDRALKAKGPIHWGVRILRYLGDKSENINRRNAAIQSLLYSSSEGKPLEQALVLARNDVNSIHFMYSRANRPLWLMKSGMWEPALSVAYMFKSWPANAMAQLFKVYASDSKRAKVLQTILLGATAGAAGIPGVDLVSKWGKKIDPSLDPEGFFRNALTGAWRYAFNKLGCEPETVKRASEGLADLNTYGYLGVAGIKGSQVLGMSNVPFSDFDDITGLYTSMAKKGLKAVDLFRQKRFLRGFEVGMPVSQVARATKAIRWMLDGEATDFSGIPLNTANGKKFKPDAFDITAAGLGFPAIEEGRAYQKTLVSGAIQEATRRKQTHLYDEVALALFSGNKDLARKLARGAIKYNQGLAKRRAKGEDLMGIVDLKLDPKALNQRLMLLQYGRNMMTARTAQQRQIMSAQQQQR